MITGRCMRERKKYEGTERGENIENKNCERWRSGKEERNERRMETKGEKVDDDGNISRIILWRGIEVRNL